jgi:Protein of unknown function (DUF2934)
MLSNLITTVNRHQWISEAAYFIAETRGFESGKELDDWLAAEIAYMEMLIMAYIAMLKEDQGSITISGLKQLATLIGITNSDSFISEAELIQAIQYATKHPSCFRYEPNRLCEEIECKWRKECRKLIAVWYR